MIFISQEYIQDACINRCITYTTFCMWDDGEVFILTDRNNKMNPVRGTITVVSKNDPIKVTSFGLPEDKVRVIITTPGSTSTALSKYNLSKSEFTGFVKCNSHWQQRQIQIISVDEELFSRSKNIYETIILFGKCIAIFGVGSIGSEIAIQLSKLGIDYLILIDGDRLEIVNVIRHAAGISHIGRYKVNVMKDLIHDRNPFAFIETWKEKITGENKERFREIIAKSDLVIETTGDETTGRIVNRLCVEENKIYIRAGAYPQVYGGQIMVGIPGKPCYQCLLMSINDSKKSFNNTETKQASETEYPYGREIPEPGLDIDIKPICTMSSQLALQILLKDKKTTRRSMDDDLVAPLYMWFNRREPGTPAENFEPLEFNIDGMHCMQWYGYNLPKHPNCPVGGNSNFDVENTADGFGGGILF